MLFQIVIYLKSEIIYLEQVVFIPPPTPLCNTSFPQNDPPELILKTRSGTATPNNGKSIHRNTAVVGKNQVLIKQTSYHVHLNTLLIKVLLLTMYCNSSTVLNSTLLSEKSPHNMSMREMRETLEALRTRNNDLELNYAKVDIRIYQDTHLL